MTRADFRLQAHFDGSFGLQAHFSRTHQVRTPRRHPHGRAALVGSLVRLLRRQTQVPLVEFFMDFAVATERHRLRQLLVRPHANVASGLELTRCLPWEPSSHEFS